MTRARALLGFLFLLSFQYACLSASAAEVPEWVSGKLLLDQVEAVGPGRDVRGEGRGAMQSSFTLFSTAAPRFSDELSGKASLRGTAFRRSLEKDRKFFAQGEVKELWIAYGRPGYELKAGQIVTPWGRSDAINPTDFLTAKDLTFLSTSEELRRRGAPGVRASFTPGSGASPFEATFAWNAHYPQTKMLLPAAGIPGGLTLRTDPGTPQVFGDRQEWALKLAYLESSYDLSVSAFAGRNHFGQFAWDGREVGLVFEKTRALGADFSVTFDHFVLRGETAYFFYDSGPRGGSGFSLTEPDHWDSVIGFERALGERIRIIAQALYRVHPGIRNPAEYANPSPALAVIGRGLGAANALIQNYQQKSEVGATLLVAYVSPEEDWRVDLSATGNFIGGGFMLRPRISHRLRDSLRAGTGMDYYGGPIGKTLGALRDYRSAFLEMEMDF